MSRSSGDRILVLADREASPGFKADGGSCLAIQMAGGETWLWGTGCSPVFLENARRLEVDLRDVRGVCLSHGHVAQTGGLEALLRHPEFQGVIVAHPRFAIGRYGKDAKAARRIGCPCRLDLLESREMRIAENCLPLNERLFMLTNIPRAPGNIQLTEGLCLDLGGQWHDTVPDDACLVLRLRDRRLAIFFGGCHSGVANTLSWVRRYFDGRIHALLGGLSLARGGDGAIRETAETLRRFDVGVLLPAGITGTGPLSGLRRAYSGRISPLAAGMSVPL